MPCGDYSLGCKACSLRVEKWQRHLDEIRDEVNLITVDHAVFHAMVDMMERERIYDLDGTFYRWIGSIYQEAVSLRIRRLLEKDPGTYSLGALLGEIAEDAPALSRERFRQLYADTVVPTDAVDGYFDRLTQRLGVDAFFAKAAEWDLEALKSVSRKVKDAADKRFAHFDRTPPKELPTWGEVDDCVSELQRVLTRSER